MSEATSPTSWIPLGRLDELSVGEAAYVEVANRALCVVRAGENEAVVFDDACPHAGGPLSGGYIEDDCLVCPLHQWPFRLADGVCADTASYRVNKYRCRINDGVVELADPGSR
jgi:nitrite reductase/ring-hydroxylating ferredoxin subunit